MNTPRGTENVLTPRKQALLIYADRSAQRWIVRDHDGNFWLLPPGEDAWARREPFLPTDDTDLEPVPGHYKDMLGLPS